MKKGKWRRLYSHDNKLIYQGYTLRDKPYGVGKAYYENGNIYQEGIFGLNGLVCGREYYPDGTPRFEGEYFQSIGYGYNYPYYGKCFSEEKERKGEIFYEGDVYTYLDYEGNPVISYPEKFMPIPENQKPHLSYFTWADAAEEKILSLEFNNIHHYHNRYQIGQKTYNIQLAAEPVKENFFNGFIVAAIIGLRDILNEYLSIGFHPERDDNITCIQTCRDGDNYRVEVIVNLHDNLDFHIMALDNVPLKEVIEHFRNVCVCFNGIDISKWNDISTKAIFDKHDKEKNIRGRSCPLCGKHFFANPYVHEICPFCGWEQRAKEQKETLKYKWLDVVRADENQSAFCVTPIKDTVRAISINTAFGAIKAHYNNILIDFALKLNIHFILDSEDKPEYILRVMLNTALLSKNNKITLGFDKKTIKHTEIIDKKLCLICENKKWLLCMLADDPDVVFENPNCILKFNDKKIAYIGIKDNTITEDIYKQPQLLSIAITIIKKSDYKFPYQVLEKILNIKLNL